ncbi:MAG TPA: bifunctional (p)ppGpp synthetase/guanosine-3',5'-bis(diphosphate) 3'-pyrophosphohydrolase [Rhodospirillales bacterium]|nr:bifunctional (p)ppGpp synthetase/guanosine-3',5'-bis(diphosphate) 3'-pyrophosphohydrolase [Rhodospirillales bacterium]
MKKLPQPSTLLLKAAQFSALKHRDQRRKDIESSPYINHPITVAHIIADIGGIEDPEILAAALLHDTIEDTKTKPSELEEMFGETIRRYVEEMTDDKALTKEIRKQKQIEHAPHLSVGATLIKLGDKISNVSDITQSPPVDWDIERRTQYLDWAEAVINNCQKVNTALEQHFSEVLSNGRKRIKNES